jgi:hypothetical protein
MLAVDFFTVETIWLQRLYVLFFIDLGSRRVHVAGWTPNPSAPWVTQQARRRTWNPGRTPGVVLLPDSRPGPETNFPHLTACAIDRIIERRWVLR